MDVNRGKTTPGTNTGSFAAKTQGVPGADAHLAPAAAAVAPEKTNQERAADLLGFPPDAGSPHIVWHGGEITPGACNRIDPATRRPCSFPPLHPGPCSATPTPAEIVEAARADYAHAAHSIERLRAGLADLKGPKMLLPRHRQRRTDLGERLLAAQQRAHAALARANATADSAPDTAPNTGRAVEGCAHGPAGSICAYCSSNHREAW